MPNPPIVSQALKPARSIWFWLVPTTAGMSILAVYVADVLELRSRHFGCISPITPRSLFFYFYPSYVMILALFPCPWERLQKVALALAVGTGVGAAGAGLFVVTSIRESSLASSASVGLLAIGLVQAAMVVSAVKLYYEMERKPRDWLTLVLGLLISFIWFSLLAQVCVMNYEEVYSIHAREGSAASGLRTINTAESTYAQTYKVGFTRTLAMLGPLTGGAELSASAAGLIAPTLAAGKRDDYTFTYTSRVGAESGPVRTYTITARPIKYGESGCQNFFTDDSGLIRETRENRPATLNDPVIPQ